MIIAWWLNKEKKIAFWKIKVGSSTTSLDMSKGLSLTHLQDEMGSHVLPSHASDNVDALVNLNKKWSKNLVMTDESTLSLPKIVVLNIIFL